MEDGSVSTILIKAEVLQRNLNDRALNMIGERIMQR